MDHLEILEVLPSCVWISSSICLHLCCLNFLQLLLILRHGPNHCFTSSSPPSIPRCPIATSSSQIFSFNFQNITCTEKLLHCEVHEFSFPTSLHSPKIDSEQESYIHFIPALQSVPNFRTHNVQFSCHISLYGSSNSLILDALEREFHGSSEYQLFLLCTSLSTCKIWWKQWGLLSNFGDVDEFDFFFDHEFMGMLCHACKTIKCTHYPWVDGRE